MNTARVLRSFCQSRRLRNVLSLRKLLILGEGKGVAALSGGKRVTHLTQRQLQMTVTGKANYNDTLTQKVEGS